MVDPLSYTLAMTSPETSQFTTFVTNPLNYTETKLNLLSHNLGDTGIISLAKAFKLNNTITHVFLGLNKITDTGVIELAEAFKVNNTLKYVNLTSNQITDSGAIALAEAFKMNTAITIVSLIGNQITEVGATALAEAFKVNTSIQQVDLKGNKINNNTLIQEIKTILNNIDERKRCRIAFEVILKEEKQKRTRQKQQEKEDNKKESSNVVEKTDTKFNLNNIDEHEYEYEHERNESPPKQEWDVINLADELNKTKEKLKNQEEEKLKELEAQQNERLKNRRTCQVCLDDNVDLHDGVECNNGHFLCNDCFSLHIITKSNEDQQSIRTRKGKVFCAGKCEGDVMTGGKDCPFEYTWKIIASHGSDDAIENCEKNIARIAAWEEGEKQAKIQQHLLSQQQNQATDDFINKTAKLCPHCKVPGTHARGHRCHAIKCIHCRKEWCYVCGGIAPCNCPFTGHTFCGKNQNGQDCGCLPCTDGCARGDPCETCDGGGYCPVCPN